MSSKLTEKESWYADGLNFTCTQCGNCCTGPPGYVWFDESEAQAISKHLKLEIDEFYRRHAGKLNGRWTLNEYCNAEGQYDCAFLTRNEQGGVGCTIYPVRPTQCRTWPFWPENLVSQRSWRRASATCPGMTRGQQGLGSFHSAEQIRTIRDSNPAK